MIAKTKVKTIGLLLSLVLSAAFFSPGVYAADWYTVTIFQVVPRALEDGDVFIQVKPAVGETRFTGTARVMIDGTNPGASKLMTVILTGLVLGQNVTINTDALPDFNTPQVVNSAGLVAQ